MELYTLSIYKIRTEIPGKIKFDIKLEYKIGKAIISFKEKKIITNKT
jgi:hypothetical protein